MEETLYQNYLKILDKELVPALGCTEPIAIAYASAKAAQLLGKRPQRLEVWCSGNIVKNVKGVIVPHSNGQRGIEIAAVLGSFFGNADAGLEVLEKVTDREAAEAASIVRSECCVCHLQEGVDNLYIRVIVYDAGDNFAEARLEHKHTFFSYLEKNGEVLLDRRPDAKTADLADSSVLNVQGILSFADALHIEDVKSILDRQLRMNDQISKQGLAGDYGANIGRTLLDCCGNENVFIRARARAAAGSDARMNGCPLPVVINAGSGNQGITIAMPILEYAESYQISKDKLYRALAVGNLISLHLKKYIGNLSAYCGATNAACGAACGIAYMQDEGYNVIAGTIINTIATIGGMVCDGAKSSCAAKISIALESALNALMEAKHGKVFADGEGLVEGDVEQTIRNIGRMGKDGMQKTDIEILNIMLHH